jgi:hypothetical protein
MFATNHNSALVISDAAQNFRLDQSARAIYVRERQFAHTLRAG